MINTTNSNEMSARVLRHCNQYLIYISSRPVYSEIIKKNEMLFMNQLYHKKVIQ